MWPSALQLTRDECRGILRRLELESYSNVISVFRAQGGLSEPKAKMLEDLRNIFHISQERHRAEARRVANDEQLSTIAEAISGPNTWQEWSREGRRPYPLLPRVPPQTALSFVANNVANDVTNENSKLQYPSETGAGQQQHHEFSTERTSDMVPVVTSDPFKFQAGFPEIRKNLKRNLPSETLTSTKKRIMSDISPSATASESPLSPATQIRKLLQNHSKTQSKQRNALAKKVTNSPAKRQTATTKKQRLVSGDPMDSNKAPSAVSQGPNNAQQLATPTAAANNAASTVVDPVLLPPPASSASHQVIVEPPEKITQKHLLPPPPPPLPSPSPQIATSKKDISKNLSKLNMITNQPVQQHEKLPECKTEKLATPVQKYIVEERSPMLVSTATTLSSHLLDKQQIIASKLKPMMTIVPTPLSSVSKAKMTSVKSLKSSEMLCSTPVSSQPQVFNVIDASTPPYVPHTPPAIINLSSKFEPEHGKVLTTKLLPMMLSAGSKLESSNGNPSHGKNVTHASPSTQTTAFRKPNIIKSSMQMKQKIQITSQQIISPPTVANIKMSPHLDLKGVPGGGPIHNRKSVKLFSSGNGLFIQSAETPAKQMAKVNTILSAQKGSTGHIVNAASSTPGRIAIQKVQIFPASNTATARSVVSKPVAITKSNMIFMPMSPTTTVKGLPIVKGNKFATMLPTQQESSSLSSSLATTAKSNVFVIGAVQSSPQTILPKEMQGFTRCNNMITEDTPVDIITTPIIVDVDSIDRKTVKKVEPIDLPENAKPAAAPSKTATTAGTALPTAVPPKSAVLQSRLALKPTYVETKPTKNTSASEDIDEDIIVSDEQNSSGNDNVTTMVIGVTDWEMELDQEASKTRALNAQKTTTQKSRNIERMIVGSEETSSADEQFAVDDVIEMQEETEEETDDGCDMGSGGNTRTVDRSMQNPESHHHHHRHHNNDDEEEETIEVGDEHVKSEGDVIQYDESYESANDELDENIAIEYVEEDQDGYEEKIDSTSSDRNEPMECNIVLIKQTTNLSADPVETVDSKSQSSKDCMVSVEEISSTTQQNVPDSQEEL